MKKIIKICEGCNKEFLANRFWQKRCSKECFLLIRQKYYIKNRKHICELRKKLDLLPENKQKIKDGTKRYYQIHKEQWRLNCKLYKLI